jgi:photosystem II stability/assembly factor-like uncharacterized protein
MLIQYDAYKNMSPYKTIIKDGWQVLGPGGGGSMFVPTVSPHDPDTALVTCDMTGTYITYDGGQSWLEINLKTRVDAITFDPVNPGVIYAGSSGLFRSEDNGKCWRLIFPKQETVTGERFIGDEAIHMYISGDNWPGGRVQAIRVDPGRPECIYLGVGLGSDIGYKAGQLLVFYSADYGNSWIELCQVPGTNILRLYADPDSPSDNRSLYIFTNNAVSRAEAGSMKTELLQLPERIGEIISAACGADPDSGKSVFFLLTDVKYEGGKLLSGVMRSTDYGRNWEEMHYGLDDDFHGPENGQKRRFRHIAACENDCRTVYLVVWRFPEIFKNPKAEMNYEGVMKTGDMGQNWSWIQKIGDDYPENLEKGWQEERYDTDWMGAPLFLDVCPTNPDICLYTSMGTAFRTADGGRTWNQLYCNRLPDGSYSGRCIEVTTCYGVHFDPFDREHMVISYTDIGGMQSTNGGKSWKNILNGVPRPWINTCYWMVFDPEVKGRAWSVWSSAHDLPRAKLFRNNHLETYGHTGGVCKSDDGINTWYKSCDGMPEDSVATHIVLDPQSPAGRRTLYVAVCGRGVYKSVDDGRTWNIKNKGITGNLYAWKLVLLPEGTLYLLVMRGQKDNRTLPGAVYKSTDGAESWQEVPMPLGTDFPNDLVFDPSKPERMYLACWPQTAEGEEKDGGLYITEDGGMSWRNTFAPASYIYGLALHPDNPSIVFFADFESSLCRSDDRGESWKRLKGYNFKWGHRPIIDPYNKDMLYVTTFGSSVWYGPANGFEEAVEDIC